MQRFSNGYTLCVASLLEFLRGFVPLARYITVWVGAINNLKSRVTAVLRTNYSIDLVYNRKTYRNENASQITTEWQQQ